MERYQRVGVLGRGGSSTVVLARLRQPGPSQEELAASGAAESPPRWRGSSPSLRPRVESEDPAAFLSAPTPSFSSSAPVSAALAAAGPAALLRVIKEVDLRGDERHRAEALREAEVLKSLAHPNIIAYHEALLVDTRLCIVMEYADGGDLAGAVARRQKAARRFLEREAMAVFVQLAIALQYIHNRRILHRDLKSKNAFLTKSGVVKLGDFGIAKVFDTADSFTETLVGTPYYLPPEMCANLPYAFPADIWCRSARTCSRDESLPSAIAVEEKAWVWSSTSCSRSKCRSAPPRCVEMRPSSSARSALHLVLYPFGRAK
mmetsp:Transcript_120894/g.386161  ORF Transcript_120894/g.386161 Transcript_120894/m.386161 type:complete len:318 (+) Transcript_120894:130-1083(+)